MAIYSRMSYRNARTGLMDRSSLAATGNVRKRRRLFGSGPDRRFSNEPHR